jgi:PKD repeat protein
MTKNILYTLLVATAMTVIYPPLTAQDLFKKNTAYELKSEKYTTKNTTPFNDLFYRYELVKLDAASLSDHLQADSRVKNVNFRIGEGKNWGLVIAPHEMRSPDFKLLIGGDNGVREYPRGANTTYKARFENDSKECARLTIDADFVQGYIRQGDEFIYIEPARKHLKSAPRDVFVVYNAKDVKPTKTHCGTSDADYLKNKPASTPPPELSPCEAGTKQVELAVAADFQSYSAWGTVEDTKNFIFAINNGMEGKYYTGIFTINAAITNVSFTMKAIYVATTAATNPYKPLTTSPDGDIRRNNFGAWGAANGFSTTYDLSQVWTHIDFHAGGDYAVGGLATLGGLCNTTQSDRNQIDEDRGATLAIENLVAHETGHNFNSPHDEDAPCTGGVHIMNGSIPFQLLTWSSCTKGIIDTYLNTGGQGATCIANCTTLATPSADFIASKINCTGVAVSFTDLSTNEPNAWAWTFTGGAPAVGATVTGTTTYAAAGSYSVSLATTNGMGTSATETKNNYVTTYAPAGTPCTVSGGTPGNNGLTNVKITNGADAVLLDNTTGLSSANGSYVNYACSKIARLSPNTTYTLSLTSGDFTNQRVWINYNNNGSFGDANELVATSGNTAYISRTYTFTTPASPTLGTILRMRVYAEDDNTTNPCSGAITSGQVEDYGIFFPAAVALPIELLDFSGKWAKNHAALLWQTASETNNYGFDIERSFNGTHFGKVGFVKSKGNSTAQQDYWFNDYDFTAPPQYVYYSLKQMDENGSYRYSKVIVLNLESKLTFQVFPNPASNQVLISTTNDMGSEILVELTDILGRTVLSQKHSERLITLQINQYAAGIYFVKVGNQRVKIIKN